MTAEENEIAPVNCRQCSKWSEVKDKVRVKELIESAILKLEDKIKAQDFKPSVGDYVKLLQLEKEFDKETTKEIRVTWVEPLATSNTGK